MRRGDPATARGTERHAFLAGIPAEPPRPLTVRVWLAWLLHSVWVRASFYLSILPGLLLVFAPGTVVRDLGRMHSADQILVVLAFAAPIVAVGMAAVEAVRFAGLVRSGVRVVARARRVRAHDSTTRFAGGALVTDTGFDYQGSRDGVNIQGRWSARVRFRRQPLEGQPIPVLFDPRDPSRRIVLWEYGLTTSLVSPDGNR